MDWEFMQMVIAMISVVVMLTVYVYSNYKNALNDREVISIKEIKTGVYKGYYEIKSKREYINNEKRESLRYINIGKDETWYCKKAGWLVTDCVSRWCNDELRKREFNKLK